MSIRSQFDAGGPHAPLSAKEWGEAVSDAVDGSVRTTGDETVAGVKTFTSSPIVPTPTTDMQAATKLYVDDNAGGGLSGLTENQIAAVAGIHPVRTTAWELGVSRSGVSDTLNGTTLEGPGGFTWATLGTAVWTRGNAGVIKTNLAGSATSAAEGVLFDTAETTFGAFHGVVANMGTTSSANIIVRYLDADNYVLVRLNRATFFIYTMVAGTLSTSASANIGWSADRFYGPFPFRVGINYFSATAGNVYLWTPVVTVRTSGTVALPGTKWGIATDSTSTEFRNLWMET